MSCRKCQFLESRSHGPIALSGDGGIQCLAVLLAVGVSYVLQEDVKALVDRAAHHWDWLIGAGESSEGGQ